LRFTARAGLGAKAGAPLTIHEVQHISIAILFWFGGLLGLLLELPAARRILSTAVLRLDGRPLADVPKPPSWTGCFNPFPALVIGITGLAMSNHHQPLVLAIEVHTLWGHLLALFAVLRIACVAPGRPPKVKANGNADTERRRAGRTFSSGSVRRAQSCPRGRRPKP
jgi:hypothetical protein